MNKQFAQANMARTTHTSVGMFLKPSLFEESVCVKLMKP